jgi:hypothetical protein
MGYTISDKKVGRPTATSSLVRDGERVGLVVGSDQKEFLTSKASAERRSVSSVLRDIISLYIRGELQH